MHDLVDGVFSPSGFPLEQKTSSPWPQREGMRFFEHTSFATNAFHPAQYREKVHNARRFTKVVSDTTVYQKSDLNWVPSALDFCHPLAVVLRRNRKRRMDRSQTMAPEGLMAEKWYTIVLLK